MGVVSYQEDGFGKLTLERGHIQLPGPYEGTVSRHMSFVGIKGDRETATFDSASGEVAVALRLTSRANPKFVPSRYMVCGFKIAKVES